MPGNSVVGPRASDFSPSKDGEASDIGCIVDAAPDVHRDSQADNSGCLDPTVAAQQLNNKTVQENEPLEARSSFPTEPKARPFKATYLQYNLSSSCFLCVIFLNYKTREKTRKNV